MKPPWLINNWYNLACRDLPSLIEVWSQEQDSESKQSISADAGLEDDERNKQTEFMMCFRLSKSPGHLNHEVSEKCCTTDLKTGPGVGSVSSHSACHR